MSRINSETPLPARTPALPTRATSKPFPAPAQNSSSPAPRAGALRHVPVPPRLAATARANSAPVQSTDPFSANDVFGPPHAPSIDIVF
jgi:hypothetical protein